MGFELSLPPSSAPNCTQHKMHDRRYILRGCIAPAGNNLEMLKYRRRCYLGITKKGSNGREHWKLKKNMDCGGGAGGEGGAGGGGGGRGGGGCRGLSTWCRILGYMVHIF